MNGLTTYAMFVGVFLAVLLIISESIDLDRRLRETEAEIESMVRICQPH